MSQTTEADASDLTYLTIAQAAQLIEARKISPVELTEAFLRRIEAINPQLDAYLLVTADLAMDQARRAEREIAKGNYLGPLHGIPFGLKDIYCTAGIRTTCHSRICADHIPDRDAAVVARLHAAGAVLLGKLATHEFAHGGPSFDLPWPPARNPWNIEHFTGGSSSGSGAAVAAGLAMAAMGSDTGGSIRHPAGMCGLIGLKPTYGLVSRAGVYPNSFTFDHCGPLTWTVEDCAIMMQALAGHDPDDPTSADRPVPRYTDALTGDIRGLRIGVIRHFYEEDAPVPAVARHAQDAAHDVLRTLGAKVEDVRLRPLQDYFDVKVVIAETELFAIHEANLRNRCSDFGADFLGRTLPAVLIRSSDYVQARRERRRIMQEMNAVYDRYDVLVTAGPGPAPKLDAWRTIQFWQKPSITTPFNVTGGPALSQCIGFTDQSLPLSIQIVGRPFDEATVMRVADAYERATPWRQRRPQLQAKPGSAMQLPPLPPPERSDLPDDRRREIAALCARAGLKLSDEQFEQICAAAPYLDAMTGRLRRDRDFRLEP